MQTPAPRTKHSALLMLSEDHLKIAEITGKYLEFELSCQNGDPLCEKRDEESLKIITIQF